MSLSPCLPLTLAHSPSGVVIDQLLSIHDSCRIRGATPLDYVSFLKAYETLYSGQVGGIEQRITSLQSGLSKLLEAEATVSERLRPYIV